MVIQLKTAICKSEFSCTLHVLISSYAILSLFSIFVVA